MTEHHMVVGQEVRVECNSEVTVVDNQYDFLKLGMRFCSYVCVPHACLLLARKLQVPGTTMCVLGIEPSSSGCSSTAEISLQPEYEHLRKCVVVCVIVGGGT